MGLNRNGKSERRGSAPLLISIFWLIATLGVVYIVAPETDLRNNRASAPVRDDARLAHESDNRSAPVQNSMRIAALEALHLKIKPGINRGWRTWAAASSQSNRLHLPKMTINLCCQHERGQLRRW